MDRQIRSSYGAFHPWPIEIGLSIPTDCPGQFSDDIAKMQAAWWPPLATVIFYKPQGDLNMHAGYLDVDVDAGTSATRQAVRHRKERYKQRSN